MKKILSFAICMIFICNAFGQENFAIPERSPEQKHQRTIGQYYYIIAAGINFAKSQDVSAYEYGKYAGSLFSQTWNKESGLNGFVRGMIFNYENLRTEADGEIVILENDDGSVVVKYPAIMIKKYFPELNPYASFQEFLDFYLGFLENIGKYMGCTVVQEVVGEIIVNTFKLK